MTETIMLKDWWYGKAMLEDNHIESIDEWSNEMEVIGHICDFFDYFWRKYDDGRIVVDSVSLFETKIPNTNSIYGDCDWLGFDYCGHIEAENAKAMCIKWLDEFKKLESPYLEHYSDDIAFIESLKNN